MVLLSFLRYYSPGFPSQCHRNISFIVHFVIDLQQKNKNLWPSRPKKGHTIPSQSFRVPKQDEYLGHWVHWNLKRLFPMSARVVFSGSRPNTCWRTFLAMMYAL